MNSKILKFNKIKEQIISFETALLAKEKGLNSAIIDLYYIYDCNGVLHSINTDNVTPAPVTFAYTQSLLQQMLRKIYHIEVNAYVNFYNRKKKLGYYYTIDKFNERNIHDGIDYDSAQLELIGTKKGFDEFEDALEIALQEALKLIK